MFPIGHDFRYHQYDRKVAAAASGDPLLALGKVMIGKVRIDL